MSTKRTLILGLVVGILAFAWSAWAVITVNRAGTGSKPVAVGTGTPVAVLAANGNRINWSMETDGTGGMYCMPGTYSAGLAWSGSGAFTAPTPAPSAGATPGIGMWIPPNTLISEKQLMLQSYMNGAQSTTEDEAKVEIDCIEVVAGNVYTWEETTK